MIYLFGTSFILWAVTFGYLFYLGAQQKQLQRELKRLCQEGQTARPSEPE